MTKTEYKKEAYKIIREAEYSLRQDHIEFLYGQLSQTPPEKLEADEFEVLNIIGRRALKSQLQHQVCEFFWRILSASKDYSLETLQVCSAKFAQMIHLWDLEVKQNYFLLLPEQVKRTEAPALPVLNFFSQVIQDIGSFEQARKYKPSGAKWV